MREKAVLLLDGISTISDKIIEEVSRYELTDKNTNSLIRTLKSLLHPITFGRSIWIKGPLGIGKSHFLKYLYACLQPNDRFDALAKLCKYEREDFNLLYLCSLIHNYSFETILIDAHDCVHKKYNLSLCKILWSEFNKVRSNHSLFSSDAQDSLTAFKNELIDYIYTKPDNFRIVFLIDNLQDYLNTDTAIHKLMNCLVEIGAIESGKVWLVNVIQMDIYSSSPQIELLQKVMDHPIMCENHFYIDNPFNRTV